jgi:hypothetical protein
MKEFIKKMESEAKGGAGDGVIAKKDARGASKTKRLINKIKPNTPGKLLVWTAVVGIVGFATYAILKKRN